MLCVEREGEFAGVIEAMVFPVSSFDDLDPGAEPEDNLERLANGFLEALAADRAAGCGADYGFEEFEIEPVVVSGRPGISFGFVGTAADGSASERNHQYATIEDDDIVSIVAIAYDEGGCPGRDDVGGFDSATLAAFQPVLESLLADVPLPPVGG